MSFPILVINLDVIYITSDWHFFPLNATVPSLVDIGRVEQHSTSAVINAHLVSVFIEAVALRQEDLVDTVALGRKATRDIEIERGGDTDVLIGRVAAALACLHAQDDGVVSALLVSVRSLEILARLSISIIPVPSNDIARAEDADICCIGKIILGTAFNAR